MADNKLIPLIKALGQPSAADITTAVDAWLDDHPEATTTVQDGSITKAKLDSNLQGTVDDVADLKSAVSSIDSEIYDYDLMYAETTASGWRLNESNGLCLSNSGYKLVKYKVTAGDVVKVVSDDRFQFQSAASVPSFAPSNRVGDTTYGAGTFVLTVPNTATYLIISTPTTSTASASKQTSAIDKFDSAISELSEKTADLDEALFGENQIDSAVLYSTTNTKLVNNNDGTYTVGTGDYGTAIFGEQITLLPGTYLLYGVSEGKAFVSTTPNKDNIFVENTTSSQISFEITESTSCYVGYRNTSIPVSAFTISPYLKKPGIDAEVTELANKVDEFSDDLNSADGEIEILKECVGATLTNFTYASGSISSSNGYINPGDSTHTHVMYDSYLKASDWYAITNLQYTDVKMNVLFYSSEAQSAFVSAMNLLDVKSHIFTSTEKDYYFRLSFEARTGTLSTSTRFAALYKFAPDTIQQKNADKLPAIYAAKNTSNFTILATTDMHGDGPRMFTAIRYLNEAPYINMGVHLGDMSPNTFASSSQYYFDAVALAEKDWFTVIGNHDAGNGTAVSSNGTQAQIYAKYIEPVLDQIGVETETTYYYKDYATPKLRIFVLNCSDLPDTLADESTFAVSREVMGAFSQAQITWLVNALASTPSNYHVLIMMHYVNAKMVADTDIKFQSSGFSHTGDTNNAYVGIIPEIIEAWKAGTTLEKTYTSEVSGMPDVTVDADFTSRGTGIFVGVLAGHTHRDIVGYYENENYDDQFTATFTIGNMTRGNGEDDLPRTKGQKSEDALTLVTIDTTHRKLYLVRVGAEISDSFVKREDTCITY